MQDGLVNVNVENVLNNNDVDVVVSVQAAAAIAANVCNVPVSAAVLGEIDQGNATFNGTYDSAARAFQGGDLTITDN